MSADTIIICSVLAIALVLVCILWKIYFKCDKDIKKILCKLKKKN